MRARLVLIPIAIAAALVAGCTANTSDPQATSTPTPTPTQDLSDNGISTLSAEEILDKAKAALAAAESFHMKGSGEDDGAAVAIDMRVVGGKDFAGTLETQGLSLEVVRLGDDVYIRAPDDFWKQMIQPGQEALLLLVQGKFVKGSATNPQFSGLVDLANTDDIITPKGTFTKGEAKTINGIPAIGLVDSQDSSVLYIATAGEPVPLRLESTSGAAVDFTEYGTVAPIEAPPAAEVLDITALTGG